MTPLPPYLQNAPAFREDMRYEYPLTPDSVVIEVGTYQGLWADAIATRYGCHIHAFEPIVEFYGAACARLARHPKVSLCNMGLANSTRKETWHIKGDMTGRFNGEGREQTVTLLDVVSWLSFWGDGLPTMIDLLALNCEGGEFELLEAVIAAGQQHRFRNICVQFHGVGPSPEERCRAIQANLSRTHHLTFHAPFCWENWQLTTA